MRDGEYLGAGVADGHHVVHERLEVLIELERDFFVALFPRNRVLGAEAGGVEEERAEEVLEAVFEVVGEDEEVLFGEAPVELLIAQLFDRQNPLLELFNVFGLDLQIESHWV